MEGHTGAAGNEEEGEFGRAATLGRDFLVQINGWETDDTQEAQLFGQEILSLVLSISKVLDLSRLEKVIVATDYHGALAEVKGAGGGEPPKLLRTNMGQGRLWHAPWCEVMTCGAW